MEDPIVNPTVLFVGFEKSITGWKVRIPHAYGDGKHFEADIDENLSIQFQPTILQTEELGEGVKALGVAAYPLKAQPKVIE